MSTSTEHRVQEIGTNQEFNQKVVNKDVKELVVVDFYATWCGTCKVMDPIFKEISTKYPSVNFYKVNADDQRVDEAWKDIQLLPTFRFYKGGEIKSTVGPNKDHILENIKNLM